MSYVTIQPVRDPGRLVTADPDFLDDIAMQRSVDHVVRIDRREDVRVVCDEWGESAQEFRRLYNATMERRDAHAGYYFSDRFFERLHAGLDGQFAYFHAVHGDKIISTELAKSSAKSRLQASQWP